MNGKINQQVYAKINADIIATKLEAIFLLLKVRYSFPSKSILF
jgi:hypothetical protein